MTTRQTMFFMVLEDMEPILREIEASVDIRYYEMGLLDSNNVPAYDSLFDTPNVGLTFWGDWNRIDRYMIMKKTTPLTIREVSQRKDGVKFAVDPMLNSNSIELKLGGIYQEKEQVIIGGRVATVSKEDVSNELYKLFSTKIKKRSNRIGSFYVGRQAEEKLKAGWRLVTNDKLSKGFDLTLDEVN